MSDRSRGRTGGRRNDFAHFVDQLIEKSEGKPNLPLQINKIATEYGVEKRRLYDLMNVLVACDVCRKTESHVYRWLSINNAQQAVRRISREIEERAIENGINTLFKLPESPAIGVMTAMFIGSFAFFSMTRINIRDISLLMASDARHYKPVLRRLYLVAFLLERVGLLKHVHKVGDYEITVNVKEICEASLMDLLRDGRFPPTCVEFMLNRFGVNYMTTIHAHRRESFDRLRLIHETVISDTVPDEIPKLHSNFILE